MHESDLAKLSEEAIKYKCRIDEITEECERKMDQDRRLAKEALEKGQ